MFHRCITVIKLLDLLRVDDPVGCVGVHWGAGLWAMIATGFFASTKDPATSGIFRKGDGRLLGWNILASITVTVWSFGMSAIVVRK